MEKDLLKNLKELKNIQPDGDYSRHSRLLILQTSRDSVKTKEIRLPLGAVLSNLSRVLNPTKLALSAGIIILTFAVSGTVYYVNSWSNQKNLVVRASEINASIQVKLDEIRYLLENKPQLNPESVLEIQLLLEKAANELKEIPVSGNKNLDKSLKNIESAQDILYRIDVLLKDQN